jgi:hypothetical protein
MQGSSGTEARGGTRTRLEMQSFLHFGIRSLVPYRRPCAQYAPDLPSAGKMHRGEESCTPPDVAISRTLRVHWDDSGFLALRCDCSGVLYVYDLMDEIYICPLQSRDFREAHSRKKRQHIQLSRFSIDEGKKKIAEIFFGKVQRLNFG